ncbi:hypothetical protein ACP4OV_029695 [Aristida adscensionis]
MAHLPRPPSLLSLIVFLVGVHVPASHGKPLPPTYEPSMCSESLRCGGVEIHYPFYLSNKIEAATANYTSYSCGYTDLNISCQAGLTATIRLGDDDYTVKNINYSTYTILLADADVPTGGGNRCPIVGRNVSFGPEWLHYTSSQDNLTFFTGCYRGDRVPAGLDAYQINCSPAPGGGVSLVIASDELDKVADEHDLAEHCGEAVVVPVLRDSLARGGVKPALPREYGAVLAQGFELAWSRSTVDKCYTCERPDSGGHCAYNQSRAFLGCLCPDGTVGVQDCKNSGYNIASPPTPSKSHV